MGADTRDPGPRAADGSDSELRERVAKETLEKEVLSRKSSASRPIPGTQLPDSPESFPRSPWIGRVIAILGLVSIGTLLFWNLGTYALWDDEANTALFATNVWKTGDTT